MPGGLHPHAHADSSLLQFSVELLSFTIAVIQLPFTALTCFLIHKSNLLKDRVKIDSYNDHVGSFLPSLGRQTTTVFSGRGSQHCYEIKSRPRRPLNADTSRFRITYLWQYVRCHPSDSD